MKTFGRIAGAVWRLPQLVLLAAWWVSREVWVRVRGMLKP